MTDNRAPVPAGANAPRVLVVGAGFAGLEVAKALGRENISVTLVDRQNHHLFQPLLYQVATAALSAPDVAEPIRSILRRYRSVEVMLGDVVAIDTSAQRVRCAHGAALSYDFLVIAAGSRTTYFGNDQWAEVAPGLKTIEDARAIRARLLLLFEKAERSPDSEERTRLMTIAVIGGGPTGVEISGAIAELSRYTLARDFRRISPASARILLVEGTDRVLGAFAEPLSTYARGRLESLGVTIMTGRRVEDISEAGLTIGGEHIPAGLVVWAAGVAPSPLAQVLGAMTDRAGRVVVGPSLEVPGLSGVFALGDIAHFAEAAGRPLPGLAQVAKQQGAHLGHALARHIRQGAEMPPFHYRSRGNTAIIGRHAAIYETRRRQLRGWPAWILWAVVHVYLLVGWQNRLLVSIQWLGRYLTYRRGARLISGDEMI